MPQRCHTCSAANLFRPPHLTPHRIENLDHLSNLVWLDLSFNKITKIEGLTELRSLEDLTLHCNDVEVLENMDTLTELKCFSIGKNRLDNLDDIAKYLRRFKKLRMLSLAGSPCHTRMQPQIYEAKVLAHLSNLKYLDYRLVDAKSVANAKAEHREHLVQVEELDKKEEERHRAEKQRVQEEQDLVACNCAGMATLFDELVAEGTEAKQIASFRESGVYDDSGRLKDALTRYRDAFDEKVREFVVRMQEHKRTKDEEDADFGETLTSAKNEIDDECKRLIKQFEKRKKLVMPRHNGHPTEDELKRTEENPKAVEDLRQHLKTLKEHLLERETNQQEAYEAVISEFETNYVALQEETIETIGECFKKLQDIEKMYRDDLEGAFEEMRQKQQTSGEPGGGGGGGGDHDRDGEWEQEMNSKLTQLESILENKEELDKLVEDSHQARQQKLYSNEERLGEREKVSCSSLIDFEKEKEHGRNRARVCEIHMYCNLVERLIRQELDEADMRDVCLLSQTQTLCSHHVHRRRSMLPRASACRSRSRWPLIHNLSYLHKLLALWRVRCIVEQTYRCDKRIVHVVRLLFIVH